MGLRQILSKKINKIFKFLRCFDALLVAEGCIFMADTGESGILEPSNYIFIYKERSPRRFCR